VISGGTLLKEVAGVALAVPCTPERAIIRLIATADSERKGFFMTANSFEDGIVEQKFVEELHLYCSQPELERLIKRFKSSFAQEFHELDDFSPVAVETEEDDYNLAIEAAGRGDFEDLRAYVIKQEFVFPVRKKNEEDLDKISNRVFGIVGETVEDVPYFSFLDLEGDRT
jgi:hypothetical protein